MRLKFFIVALVTVILTGCTQAESLSVNPRYEDKGRFDVLDKFKSFDSGIDVYSYLLKDRVTEKCYLFVSVNAKNSGMVEAPCKK